MNFIVFAKASLNPWKSKNSYTRDSRTISFLKRHKSRILFSTVVITGSRCANNKKRKEKKKKEGLVNYCTVYLWFPLHRNREIYIFILEQEEIRFSCWIRFPSDLDKMVKWFLTRNGSTLWQVHGVMHTTASLSPLSKDYTLPGADVTTLTKQQDDPVEDRCSRIRAYRYPRYPWVLGLRKMHFKEIFMRLPACIHPRAWYTFQREG